MAKSERMCSEGSPARPRARAAMAASPLGVSPPGDQQRRRDDGSFDASDACASLRNHCVTIATPRISVRHGPRQREGQRAAGNALRTSAPRTE